MSRVSVVEAAEILGVHPQRIHQRIRDGSLPAERIGRQWSIEEADLALVKHRRSPGRPLSARSAWALVAIASANVGLLAGLSPAERSRARSRLRALLELASAADLGEAAGALPAALGNRARRVLFAASPRDLPDLRSDGRLRASGLSLPGANISAGDIVEGYVMAGDVDGLVRDYLLSPSDQRRASAVLHVVDSQVEDLIMEAARDSLLVRAADLVEHGGVREKEAAVRALAQLRDWFVVNDPRMIGP